jgi:hypothetical protein
MKKKIISFYLIIHQLLTLEKALLYGCTGYPAGYHIRASRYLAFKVAAYPAKSVPYRYLLHPYINVDNFNAIIPVIVKFITPIKNILGQYCRFKMKFKVVA